MATAFTLTGAQPGIRRRLEPGDDVLEAVTAGEAGEVLRHHGVETDVHPVQARGRQGCGQAVEADAVRRHRDARPGLERGDPAYDVDEAPTQERLAARHPHRGDPQPHEHGDDPHELVVGEHLGLGHPVQTLGRHAVGAAQVAAVGDRHPQVTADPTEAVEKARGGKVGHRAPMYVAYRGRVLRRLVTPRWLGALLLAVVFAVLCYRLGWWQYDRHLAKVERNERLDEHYRAEPVPLDSVLTPSGARPGRRVDPRHGHRPVCRWAGVRPQPHPRRPGRSRGGVGLQTGRRWTGRRRRPRLGRRL